jgi:hypothetical protein
VRDHELTSSYDTLWRFAHQELAWREKPSTVRVDDPPPGQEAQIDFGKMGFLVDDGRKRTLWALVVTLVFSRYQFVNVYSPSKAIGRSGGNLERIRSRRKERTAPRTRTASLPYVPSDLVVFNTSQVRTCRQKE